MATTKLTLEEALEELRHPSGGQLWAANADSNDLEGGWTGLEAGNLDMASLEPITWADGPFVLTSGPDESPSIDAFAAWAQEQADANSELDHEDDAVLDYTDICPLDGDQYDSRYDLVHELHDSEHPNHYKWCDIAFVGHYHDGSDIPGGLTDGALPLPLETVRFEPRQALSRLQSFVSIFRDDGMTEMTTLDAALDSLNDFLRTVDPGDEKYRGF